MNMWTKAVVLCTAFVAGQAIADEDPRGKFVNVDLSGLTEQVLITPLSCKFFVEQAVEVTTMYMDGVDEQERLKVIFRKMVPVIANDDKYAGNALAVYLNKDIVNVLADPSVKKDIGYGYTYPQSIGRQMPKSCANMVGTKTEHIKRIFEKET